MDFDQCVKFLKENFQDIPNEKIVDSINLCFLKKYENDHLPKNENCELTDNDLIELMEQLSNWKEQEELKRAYTISEMAHVPSDKEEEEAEAENEKREPMENLTPVEINEISTREHFQYNKKELTETPKKEQVNPSSSTEKREQVEWDCKMKEKKEICLEDEKKQTTKKDNSAETICDDIIQQYDTQEPLSETEGNKNEGQKNIEQKNIEQNNIEQNNIEQKNIEQKDTEQKNIEQNNIEQKDTEQKQMTRNTMDTKTRSNNVPSFFEIVFSTPLLKDENIQKNIEAKNFYIIDKDMLINIIIIMEKIINQLIIFYSEQKKKKEEQISHFQNVFKVLHKLLNNIYLHPNEEKYRFIKFSNNQIRSCFSFNDEIFGTTELLFQVLRFNTCYLKPGQNEELTRVHETKQNMTNEIRKNDETDENIFHEFDTKNGNMENKEDQQHKRFSLIWKFENVFTDVESILFEFVLSSIKIILTKVNTENHNKIDNTNELQKEEPTNKKNIPCTFAPHEQKQYCESASKKVPMFNSSNPTSKTAVICQRHLEKKKEIDDIRKLYDERYKKHKMYGNQKTSHKFVFLKNKEKQKYKNKNKEVNNGVNASTVSNTSYSSEENNEKKAHKKKKIKQWFKKIFKGEKK